MLLGILLLFDNQYNRDRSTYFFFSDVENILSDLLFSRGRYSFSFIDFKYDRNRFKKHDELDVIQTVS